MNTAANQLPRIVVEARERLGSRYAARLRRGGRLPAVIYGHGKDPSHVSFNAKEVTELLHSHARIFEVAVADRVEPCLVKAVQWDHLGSHLVHLDLARVDLNERITINVELALVGEAPGLKEEGAILEHPVAEIEIECLAMQIPDRLTLDVSSLGTENVLTVADLKLPAGVTTTMDPETVLASISIVREEVVAPAAGEGGAEPEVIGKKAEEEGDAAAAKKDEKK